MNAFPVQYLPILIFLGIAALRARASLLAAPVPSAQPPAP